MAEEEKVTAVAEEATSMADYEKELEASFKKLEEGDMITGTVIAVDEEEITLDLRYYTEGIIKVSDYSRFNTTQRFRITCNAICTKIPVTTSVP